MRNRRVRQETAREFPRDVMLKLPTNEECCTVAETAQNRCRVRRPRTRQPPALPGLPSYPRGDE
jgi:hypothetical protein